MKTIAEMLADSQVWTEAMRRADAKLAGKDASEADRLLAIVEELTEPQQSTMRKLLLDALQPKFEDIEGVTFEHIADYYVREQAESTIYITPCRFWWEARLMSKESRTLEHFEAAAPDSAIKMMKNRGWIK